MGDLVTVEDGMVRRKNKPAGNYQDKAGRAGSESKGRLPDVLLVRR